MQAAYDQVSPLLTQVEKKLTELRSLIATAKSELMMEMHDKVSQSSLSLEIDFKKKQAELQQQISEVVASSMKSKGSHNSGEDVVLEQLKRKVEENRE